MDNYILIGIPSSGKSTLGQRAAEIFGMDFYDIDVIARERASKKRRLIPMSFACAELLMEEESKVVEELAQTAKRSIIATGAEAPLGARNAYILKKMGTLIYLKRDPDVIITDIRENKRPCLVLENEETHETINILECAVKEYAKYRAGYAAIADITLDNNGEEDAGLEQLVTIIKAIEKTKEETKAETKEKTE